MQQFCAAEWGSVSAIAKPYSGSPKRRRSDSAHATAWITRWQILKPQHDEAGWGSYPLTTMFNHRELADGLRGSWESRPRVTSEDIVIEALKGFPDNVAAFACHGHVTKADYETVLIPHIEHRLKRHQKTRIYAEIAPDFTGLERGAVWEDTKLRFSHFFAWQRSALVTDVKWMKHSAKFFGFFGFLLPGEWRAFPTAEAGKAREWIVEPQQ